jgi:hypothetical protein
VARSFGFSPFFLLDVIGSCHFCQFSTFEGHLKRRILVASKFQTFLVVTLVGSIWIGAFSTAGKFFAPDETPRPSSEAKNVQAHFVALAQEQRRVLGFESYYLDRAQPGQVTAILDFTTTKPIPVRAPALDGFRTGHVNISLGKNGVRRVFASFTRPEPYTWPRTLDVFMGPHQSLRCDIDEDHSTPSVALYAIASPWKLDMQSPNGHFAWTTSKDNNVLNADDCLYRQDLYKDGEYYKSLIAVATALSAVDNSSPASNLAKKDSGLSSQGAPVDNSDRAK